MIILFRALKGKVWSPGFSSTEIKLGYSWVSFVLLHDFCLKTIQVVVVKKFFLILKWFYVPHFACNLNKTIECHFPRLSFNLAKVLFKTNIVCCCSKKFKVDIFHVTLLPHSNWSDIFYRIWRHKNIPIFKNCTEL